MMLKMLKKILGLLITVFVTVLLVMAVYVSLGRQLLPYVVNYRADIEARFTENLGLQVQIGALGGAWSGFNPILALERVLIFPSLGVSSDQVVQLDTLTLELDVWTSLLQRRWMLKSIDILNPEFALSEGAEGQWQLRGVALSSNTAMDVSQLLDLASRVGDLTLSNMRLSINRYDGRRAEFERSRLRLQNRGNLHHLHLDVWQPDVIGPLSLAAEFTGNTLESVSGQLYLIVPDNDYSEILSGEYAQALNLSALAGNGELWMQIDDGRVSALQGSLDIDRIGAGIVAGAEPALIENLQTRFFLRRHHERSEWEAWLDNLTLHWSGQDWRESNLYLQVRDSDRVELSADVFNLGIAAGLITSLDVLNPAADLQLTEHNLRGELLQLKLQWLLRAQETEPAFSLHSNLSDVAMSARETAPALWGVDGYTELSFAAQEHKLRGFVEVDSSRFMFQLPQMYNEAWAYERVNGRVNFELNLGENQSVQLSSGVIVAESDVIKGRAQFSSTFSRTSAEDVISELELMVGVSSADLSHTSAYLPNGPNVQPNLRNAMSWIDAAVIDGLASKSGLIFRGSVLPGATAESRTLQMYYGVDEGILRFDPQWPDLESLRGYVVISDRDVDIRVDSGESLGVGFDSTVAFIRPNLEGSGSWLTLVGAGGGNAPQALQYLRATPVTRGFGEYIADWQVSGAVGLDLSLRIPLGIDGTAASVNIDLQLQGNNLFIPELELEFASIEGLLGYNTSGGLRGEELSAMFFNAPVTVDLSSVLDTGPETATSVNLRGVVAARDLASWPRHGAFVAGILDRAEGDMEYQAQLDILQSESPQTRLRINSALQGVSLNFPAPFNKSAVEHLPVDITLDFLEGRQNLQMSLADTMSLNIDLVSGSIRNGLVFFGQETAGIRVRQLNPGAPGLDIVGSLRSFDYDAWMSALRPETTAEIGNGTAGTVNFSGLRQTINTVDINVAQAHAFGQDIADLNVQITGEDRDWRIALDSERVLGEIRVPYAQNAALNVQLAHLRFPAAPDTEAQNLLASQVPQLGVVPETLEIIDPVDPLDAFDPRSLPRMRFSAEEVWRGDADFGRWEFSLEPGAGGVTLSDLLINARGLQVGRPGEEGRFVWTFDGSKHHSYLDAVLETANIAPVLSAFGYAPSLESASAVFQSSLNWPGSPAYFAARDLSGDLALNIAEGRFQQSGAGAGNSALKLISIINFDALVRRLRFSDDLVRRGLAYEQIYGAVTLDHGVVNILDRLQIIGPASLFQVSGEIDLAEQTIDGSLYITLPVSDNIPWLSGIAVLNNLINWQLAVGVFLFDQVFGDQVDSLTSAQYTLQGPWDGLEPELMQVFGTPSDATRTVPAQSPASSPQNPSAAGGSVGSPVAQ